MRRGAKLKTTPGAIPCIAITMVLGRLTCHACGNFCSCSVVALDGSGTTGLREVGTSQSELIGVSLQVKLLLCKPCLEATRSAKRLILRG